MAAVAFPWREESEKTTQRHSCVCFGLKQRIGVLLFLCLDLVILKCMRSKNKCLVVIATLIRTLVSVSLAESAGRLPDDFR